MPAKPTACEDHPNPGPPPDLFAEAVDLAQRGWAVFPLRGKLPAISKDAGGKGFHDASTDLELIRAWWERYPGANIGLALPRGVVVLDVDPRHGGEETIAALQATHGQLPPTQQTITGTGGRHLFFQVSTERLEQKNIGPGVDTRIGGRGYVLAPPSIHPETGQPYAWRQPTVPIAGLPLWIGQILLPPSRWQRPAKRVVGAGAETGLLEWAAGRVAGAASGKGHEVLLRTAILLGGYVAGGVFSALEAESCLVRATAGWDQRRNIESTVRDGLSYGATTKGAIYPGDQAAS